MKSLKVYTKNLYGPKASIVVRYIAEEAVEFFSEYIEKAKPIGLLEYRHEERVGRKGSRGLHVITPTVRESGTLLNIQGKTKDGLNTRQDLAKIGIQLKLHRRSDGKKI